MMNALEDETRSILFSSHNTLDVEQISDYITFLYGGRIVESRDKETFLDSWRRLRLTNPHHSRLPELPNIREVQQSGRLCAGTVTDYNDAIPGEFINAGLSLEGIEALSLEDIFLSNVHYAKEAGLRLIRNGGRRRYRIQNAQWYRTRIARVLVHRFQVRDPWFQNPNAIEGLGNSLVDHEARERSRHGEVLPSKADRYALPCHAGGQECESR